MPRPSFLASLLLLSCSLFPACSSSDSPSNPAADADPLAPDADPTAPDGGADTPDGGGELPAIDVCQQSCNAPADCATASAAFDADNYACEDNRCVYLGCNSTEECTSALGAQYVCASSGAIDTCVLGCSGPADCATASPAFDADNYACEEQKCVYQGCNSTDECVSAFGADYVCGGTGTIDSCQKGCSVPADCATGSAAFDADNYACEDNLCVYLGCNSSAECMESVGADYVCSST